MLCLSCLLFAPNKRKINGRARRQRAQTRRPTSAPLAAQRRTRAQPPRITQRLGDTIVRHREFIADVVGVTTFGVVTYAINPGVAATFPWLSTVAQRYESYRFQRLEFCYETTRSASTDGAVEGAIDYDAADAPPTTKSQLMAFCGAVRSGVWQEFRFNAKPRDVVKFASERFVRSGAPAANLDIKTYDVGNFHIGASGCADTSAIGELYVEYTVHLRTPQLSIVATTPSATLPQQYIYQGGTLAADNIFGSAPVYFGGNYATAVTNTLTFTTPGEYIVEYFGTENAVGIVNNTGSTCTIVVGVVTTVGEASYAMGRVTAAAAETLVFGGVTTSNTTLTTPSWVVLTPATPAVSQRMRYLRSLPVCDLTRSVMLTSEEKSSGAWMKVR